MEIEFLDAADYSARARLDEVTDEDRAEIDRAAGLFRALGLLAGEVDLVDALSDLSDLSDSGTLAFYDPEQERITVRGQELTPAVRGTLVHELTHALQDQHFDLGALLEEAGEAGMSFVADAVIEGDAMRIEHGYVESLGAEDAAAYEAAQVTSAADVAGLEAVPDALVSLFGAPYAFGDLFVQVVTGESGPDVVDELFRDLPASEQQVFDPVAWFEGRPPVDVAVPDVGDAEVDWEGPFGVPTLYLVLATRIGPKEALAAADAWAGDASVTFRRDERSCVAISFATAPGEADLLTGALESWRATLPAGTAVVGRAGDLVELESCDPGTQGELARGDQDPFVLPVVRTTLLQQWLAEGAEMTAAACFAGRVVDELPLELLTAASLTDEELAQVSETANAVALRC
ncbi:MAG: hypothetical protein GEV08_20340 [Acidimicrobiia bacterium]|nr:hypothetical protein [Acidimicrobiia bacterium]